MVTIKWQNNFETNSRFIYYGVGTRNEYRLTRFGKGFPFLSDDNVGDLLIICNNSHIYYEAFVLIVIKYFALILQNDYMIQDHEIHCAYACIHVKDNNV